MDSIEAPILQIPLAQRFWRIALAPSIQFQETPINGITGNVCNQRSRCSGCGQSPRDRVIRALFWQHVLTIGSCDSIALSNATDVLRLLAIILSQDITTLSCREAYTQQYEKDRVSLVLDRYVIRPIQVSDFQIP